ncbi:MAG: BrnA antitoxin family protein [Candidatus Angelobacter sp.]
MSAKPIAKSSRRSAVPNQGRAKIAKLRRLTDAEIARSSPEELRDLPKDFWDDAVPVLPGTKVPISLRVDADVLEFFRESGPRYQSRMNAVLRSYMERTSASPSKRPKRRGIA